MISNESFHLFMGHSRGRVVNVHISPSLT
jgi:hypothetical protein